MLWQHARPVSDEHYIFTMHRMSKSYGSGAKKVLEEEAEEAPLEAKTVRAVPRKTSRGTGASDARVPRRKKAADAPDGAPGRGDAPSRRDMVHTRQCTR